MKMDSMFLKFALLFSILMKAVFYTIQQMLSPTVQQKPDQNPVLEHSLHQLLREMHYKNIHHPMPHPVTAMLGMSKRRRLAGPQAADRKSLLEMTER